MRRVAMGLVGLVSLCLAGAAACGAARLPAPTYVGQPTEALREAKYPPPPARVEFVPERPNEEAVWVDGEWTWQSARWAWKPGRWLVPPKDAKYSPWTAVRGKAGTLFVAEGRWRDEKGRELPDPKPIAVGSPRAGAVVTPDGDEATPGPNVPAQDPPGAGAGSAGDRDGGNPETPSGATPTGTLPKDEPPEDAGSSDASSTRMSPR